MDKNPVVKEAGGVDWAENTWKISWTYIRTVVDTIREPFVILDHDLRVIAANETFYRTFQVPVEETEKKMIYDLGDGQWDIPSLRKCLEDVLSKDTFFKGFEVDHEFPAIGRKVMLLNARQIHQDKHFFSEVLKPIILLAIEDITEITMIAKKLAGQTNEYEMRMTERTKKIIAGTADLEVKMEKLSQLGGTGEGFNPTMAEFKEEFEGLKAEILSLGKR
jgi:hypothetical protein